MPNTGVGDEARIQYEQTVHALDEYIRKCFNEWTFSLENVRLMFIVLSLPSNLIHKLILVSEGSFRTCRHQAKRK